MQKFCIWETRYKIPKIDCIKLQSQSKLLGHFCVFSCPQCWCTRFGDWIAINSFEREKERTRKAKKTVFALSVFLSGTVGLSLEWLWEVNKEKKKEKKKETRFLKFNIHKKAKVVTKISNCRLNTTSRREIKQLRISFGSIFLLFSYESIRGKSPAPASQWQPGFTIVPLKKLYIVWHAHKEGLIILGLTAQFKKNHSCTFKITTEPSHGMWE